MSNGNSINSFKQMIHRYLKQSSYVKTLSEECPFFPQHVHIGPTNVCNLRCIHCHYHVNELGKTAINRKKGMMTLDLHSKIIDEIAPLNCSVTYAIHGEPTLNKHFLDMVAYAKKNQLFTSLLTNGTRVNNEMAKKLLELKLDRIVFSFDAVDKKLYEKIRVGAIYEKVMYNILNFIKLNHENGHHTHVCLSIILQNRTKNHISKYKKYFNKLPIDKIFVSNLLTLSGGSGVSNEIKFNETNHNECKNSSICRIPWEDLAVTWDGDVIVCPLDYNVYYSIGNVSKQSLFELWNNDRIKQFRKAQMNKDFKYIEKNGPLCSQCNCLNDSEYDISNYDDFAVEAIYRNAIHYAKQLFEKKEQEVDSHNKFQNLLKELDKFSNY